MQAGPPDFTFRALSHCPLEAPSVCRSAAPWGSGTGTLTSLSWTFQLEQAMPISHGALEGADTNKAWGSGILWCRQQGQGRWKLEEQTFSQGSPPRGLARQGPDTEPLSSPHLPWASLLL